VLTAVICAAKAWPDGRRDRGSFAGGDGLFAGAGAELVADYLNSFKCLHPSGKSILIYRNSVKLEKQKYFAFPEEQISGTSIAILLHQEGRSRSSRNAGQGAVDAEVPSTNGTDAYGEDVWS